MALTIEHDPAAERFHAVVEGWICVVDYRLRDGVMAINHTGVPPQLEGRGIAGALVQAVLDHARAHDLKVLPLCSYADATMRRHPQTLSLRAQG